MMRKFVLLLVGCLVYVNSQSFKGENGCNGPPNVYYNFGSDTSTIPNINSNKNIKQGRPGKSGVQGIKGQKGSTGQKGDAGTPDETTEQIQFVESRLDVLNITSKTMKLALENQSKKLNDTNNQLEVLKHQFQQQSKSKQTNDKNDQLEVLKQQLHQLEIRLFSLPQSCDDVNTTARQSGTFIISPDPMRVQPFSVFCNFAGNSAETIIRHDSEDEIRISNCDPARCYKRTIQYSTSMQQIKALIQRSSQCRQFIKYRCVRSLMFKNQNPTSAAWLSRDGKEKIYWGGATSRRDRYCACGESGSCANRSYKCNCDANDRTTRHDEGYLTDKADLPVTGLQFGDTGHSSESGWHTLGPLICSG